MGRPKWSKEEKEQFRELRRKHPSILARIAKRLEPRAKRGKKALVKRVKKRVPKRRKSTTKRKRKSSSRKRRRRRR